MIDELSIITPTLNEERYLPRLLESVARQTFAGRLEVIASDRRVRLMGRWKLLSVWARGFIQVARRDRPVFPDEGYEYPFGHYDAMVEDEQAKK